MAWLHAVVNDDKENPSFLSGRSRLQALYGGNHPNDMPPCRYMYLANILSEIGPVFNAGIDLTPISFFEVQAFIQCTSINLNAFESRLLVSLSKQYLAQLNDAKDAHCPAPWQTINKPTQQTATANKIRSLLRS